MQMIVKYYRIVLTKLKQFLQNLEPRERFMLFSLLATLSLIVISFSIFQLFSLKFKLSENVINIRTKYNYLLKIGKSIDTDNYDFSEIEPGQFFLTFNSLLEENQLVVSNIDEINENDRSKYRINLELRSAKIGNVFRFLHSLEIANRINAKIERISLRKSLSAEESYDVDLVVKISDG